MKKAFYLALAALVCAGSLSAQTFPSKWKLTKTDGSAFEMLWEADRSHIRANECGEGWLDAPKCEGLREGDVLTWHFPVKKALKAGSFVEFDIMLGTAPGSPKYFAVEYCDGGKWVAADTVKCVGGASEPATVIQTFRFSKKVKDEVLVRLRAIGNEACDGSVIGSTDADSHIKLMPYGYIAGYANDLGTTAPKDTVKVGYVGNSFTFVNSGDFCLKEIAWCEGHYLDMHVNNYPGARFRNHLGLTGSLDVISEGGYDWFILQDQSTQAARYGRDKNEETKNFTRSIAKVIRYFSPKTRILLEQTWAFSQEYFGGFGGYDYFDKCSTEGAAELAEVADASVSPIAKAFAVVRAEHPEYYGHLYSTDDHHPAAYGAYLKACCNYLMIFRTPFTSDRATFGLDPQICNYLKDVAQRICLDSYY